LNHSNACSDVTIDNQARVDSEFFTENGGCACIYGSLKDKIKDQVQPRIIYERPDGGLGVQIQSFS
jgi:hypothetical protein